MNNKATKERSCSLLLIFWLPAEGFGIFFFRFLDSFALAGDFLRAARLHRRLYPVFKALFIETNPAPIKTALAAAGLISSPEVRLPLCELAPASAATLQKTLAAFAR